MIKDGIVLNMMFYFEFIVLSFIFTCTSVFVFLLSDTRLFSNNKLHFCPFTYLVYFTFMWMNFYNNDFQLILITFHSLSRCFLFCPTFCSKQQHTFLGLPLCLFLSVCVCVCGHVHTCTHPVHGPDRSVVITHRGAAMRRQRSVMSGRYTMLACLIFSFGLCPWQRPHRQSPDTGHLWVMERGGGCRSEMRSLLPHCKHTHTHMHTLPIMQQWNTGVYLLN